MDNRTVVILTSLALAAMALLFVMRLMPYFKVMDAPAKYVQLSQVKGVTIVHLGRNYTLSSKQQKEFVGFINQMEPVIKSDYKQEDLQDLDFAAILIDRFDQPTVELKPVAFVRGNLIFDAPQLNASSYLRDFSDGGLDRLIKQSFEKKSSSHEV